MKTLVVHYLPSGPESETLRLLKVFEEIAPAGDREVLDLLEQPAPLFNRESMAAYLKRNYRGEPLTEAEAASLAPQDKLIAQLKSADVLVMAYPMHNFSMPAAVKAYIDAVMAKGVTFKRTSEGIVPMMGPRKALTLYTAGTEYPQGRAEQYPYWDGVSALAKIEFEFMGFAESQSLGVSLRGGAEVRTAKLAEARRWLEPLVARWYETADELTAAGQVPADCLINSMTPSADPSEEGS